MSKLNIYSATEQLPVNSDYSVRVREAGGEWQSLFIYAVKVDMHDIRETAMCLFDMAGAIDVEVTVHHKEIEEVTIRPFEKKIDYQVKEDRIYFSLLEPVKLSIEVNQGRYDNLHLFANEIESKVPDIHSSQVIAIQPGIHRAMDLLALLNEASADGQTRHTLYFLPGTHYIEETTLYLPSDKSVYLAGGSVVIGSFVCEEVENIHIFGRGIIYLSNFERFTAFRGVRIAFSHKVKIEGIHIIDPPHYSVFIGQSQHITIDNIKCFSKRGWSDGIDMMSSQDIYIHDVFMRNSDDCIAIYGSRWDFTGDTKNVTVKNSILWADVAHPIMVGTHGNYDQSGDTIENVTFVNIDILEHHEPQENYWGAMALNAGDKNVIKNITFQDIRVDDFELGQLLDIRVVYNKDYNPCPGHRIENILFKNISYKGKNELPSRIYGYDKERIVENVTFENIKINGKRIESMKGSEFDVNSYVKGIHFK